MFQLQIEKLSDAATKCDISWNIDNFPALSKDPDLSVDSPHFAIANATWCLRMHPNEEKEEASFISLKIMRLESDFSQHSVCFHMGIQAADNDIDFWSSGNRGIEEDNSCVVLDSEFISHSGLEDEAVLYLPLGKLTVCFLLHITGITKKKESELLSRRYHLGSYAKLVQDLKNLVLSKTDSDVTIRVKGQEFPAHRAIIGVRSPVFAAMLRSEMKEKTSGIVDIEDLDPDVFLDFLCFLYTGGINELSAKNVFGLYTAADMFDIAELKSTCSQYMKSYMSIETFCDVARICFLHDEKELLNDALNYFSKHVKEILESVKWQTFLCENPIQSNELLIKMFKKFESRFRIIS